MIERIDEKELKKGKRFFSFDVNTNSKLYRNGDSLTKYPISFYYDFNQLEQTLEYIDKNNVKCCVEIKKLICRNDKVIAYTMTFYQDYKSLRKLLNRPLALKKYDCYHILKSFDELNNKRLNCQDVHLSNFLINGFNCLVCDLDALTIMDNDNFKEEQCRSAIALCLAYIYNMEVSDVLALLRDGQPFIVNNSIINPIINNISPTSLLDFRKVINLMDQEEINKTRKDLNSGAKKLRLDPYYRKYYGK